MQIKRLRLENFGSYEEAEIDLVDLGLVLLEGENRDAGGSNGAGKTTLLNAICWGLYGKVPNIKGADKLVRMGKKTCSVEVDLQVDGRDLKVRRTKEGTIALEFWIDEVDSRLAGSAETQKAVVSTLGMDYQTFLATVLFPQGGAGLASLTDKESKHVLSQILRLDRFEEGKAKVSAWLKADLEGLQDLKGVIRGLDRQLEQAQGSVEALKIKEEEFQANKISQVETLASLIQRHVLAKPPPSEGPCLRRDELLVEYSNSRQDDALNLHDQATHKHSELLQRQANNAGRLGYLTEPTVIDPEEEFAKHSGCPSCGQSLPQEARDALLLSFTAQRDAQWARAQEVVDQRAEIHKEQHEIAAQLSLCETAIASFTEVVQNSQRLERAIAEVNLEIEAAERVQQQWAAQLHQLKRRQEDEQNKESPYESLIEGARSQATKVLQLISDKQAQIAPAELNIRMLKFWQEGFGNRGMKSLLLSTVTPYLNERANVYIKELSGGQASIEISTQKQLKSGEWRDQLSFEVQYPNTSAAYDTKSGGEKRRADIAIQFAMADLAATQSQTPVRLELLDEPFDNLDAQGAEQVVDLLIKHIVPTRGTVLVLSHSDALKSLFEQRITVVKQGGISRLVN